MWIGVPSHFPKMNWETPMTQSALDERTPRRGWAVRVAVGLLVTAWTTVRLPALAILLVMEPIVCGVLSAVAALGVLCALFFEFVAKVPHYPFWLMMGVSAGLALLMVPYYLLVRFLSGPSK